MCEAAVTSGHTYIHTYIHTHTTITITLTAHAHRGLIMYYNLHNLDCIFNSTMSRIEAARVLGNFNVNAVYI